MRLIMESLETTSTNGTTDFRNQSQAPTIVIT